MAHNVVVELAQNERGMQVLTLAVDGHSITNQVFYTDPVMNDNIVKDVSDAIASLGLQLGVPAVGDSDFVDQVQDAGHALQMKWRKQRDANKA